MPLPLMKDRRAYHVDALLVLTDRKTISATTSETGIAFDVTKLDVAKLVAAYGPATGIDASNYWTISLEASTTLGGTYVEVASTGNLPETGELSEAAFSGLNVEEKVPGAAFVRVTATKTGTAGDLTYEAFISPNTDNK